ILGSYAPEGKSLLALAGRTPVKISAENGPIDIGDYLTSSSQPGIAMKATEPGVVIGRALETGGADKIEVLVGTKESNFVGDINARQEQIDKLTRQNQQIRERISVLEAILSKKG
ncbi:MAG TPA: hypothetical protein VJB05_03100, partial [archaeon]|nr:hypothetical protein [archaeon]